MAISLQRLKIYLYVVFAIAQLSCLIVSLSADDLINGSDLISPKAKNGLLQPRLQDDDDDESGQFPEIQSPTTRSSSWLPS